jgi:hypothetical protein
VKDKTMKFNGNIIRQSGINLIGVFVKPARLNPCAGSIYVTIKYNYGKRAVYPVCDMAQNLSRIAGTKTLTERTIKEVKELGYTVKVLSEIPEQL